MVSTVFQHVPGNPRQSPHFLPVGRLFIAVLPRWGVVFIALLPPGETVLYRPPSRGRRENDSPLPRGRRGVKKTEFVGDTDENRSFGPFHVVAGSETRRGGAPLFSQTAAKPRFGKKVVRRRSESNGQPQRGKALSLSRLPFRHAEGVAKRVNAEGVSLSALGMAVRRGSYPVSNVLDVVFRVLRILVVHLGPTRDGEVRLSCVP